MRPGRKKAGDMICQKKAYYECIVPERNKRAFYELVAGKDLFGFVMIRRWGRIPGRGTCKRQDFREKEEMLKEYEHIHRKRIKYEYVHPERSLYNFLK